MWYHDEAELDFYRALILIFLIALAMLFETVWHHMAHRAAHSYRYGAELDRASASKIRRRGSQVSHQTGHKRLMEELANRTGAEFMVLGFLAFCIFLINTTGRFEYLQTGACKLFGPDGAIVDMSCPQEAEEWLELCEAVHMKIFVAMILYFLLMHRVARRSGQLIEQWERFQVQWEKSRHTAGMTAGGSDTVAAHVPSWEMADLKPDRYLAWRGHFVKHALSWKYSRPEVFAEVLEKLGLARGDDELERFGGVLQERFDFSAYLATNVEGSVSDSIHVAQSTWLFVMLVFIILACVHAAHKVALIQLKSGILGLLVVLIGVMYFVVRRAERHIRQAEGVESSSGAGAPQQACRSLAPAAGAAERGEAAAPATAEATWAAHGRRGTAELAEEAYIAECIAEASLSGASWSFGGRVTGASSPCASQPRTLRSQSGMQSPKPATSYAAIIGQVHEKYQTELFLMRVLQFGLFLTSYLFASRMLDDLGLLSTHGHTFEIHLFLPLLGFFVLFLLLALLLPSRVARFLAIAALPPYVDMDNVAAFVEAVADTPDSHATPATAH